MRECPTCGFANSFESNYCAQCGTRLVAPTGDTTNLIPVIDDDAVRAEFDIDEAATLLAPDSALLIVTRGLGAEARFLLDQPVTTVGRSPSCDILLDDITVSRHHATFELKDGAISLTDAGSLNGTYVNRELINGRRLLKRGDEVQIGKFRMVVLTNERGTI